MINDVARFELKDARLQEKWWSEHLEENLCPNVSLKILSLSNWPVARDTRVAADAILPPSMSLIREKMQEYCKGSKFLSSKKLMWSMTLGEVSLQFTPGSKVYDVLMSPIQAMVCMHFANSKAKATVAELQSFLNIPDEQFSVLKKIVHSLSCHKRRLLQKSGSSNKVLHEDVLQANISFQSRRKRFSMPSPPLDMKAVKSAAKEE